MEKKQITKATNGGRGTRGRWSDALLPKLAVACVAGCSLQAWEQPEQVGEEANIGVVAEALGSTTQSVYVVTQNGADGYCNGVLHSGNHGAAIQSCIDLASADGGGRAVVRGGTYSTGTWPLTLKSNVTLAGEGQFAAKLAPAAAQIIGTMQDNSAIEGISFDMTNVSEGAVRLGASAGLHSNLRFEDNSFLAANPVSGIYYAIYAPSGANSFNRIAVRGNSFQVNTFLYGGVHLHVSSGSGTIDAVHVQNNDFSIIGNANAGNAVFVSSETSTTASRGLVVTGNSMRTTGYKWGFGVYTRGVLDAQITGNAIQATAYGVGLYEGPPGSSCGGAITGNNFRGGYFASVGSSCAANSVVVGNSADTPWAPSGKDPVLVRAWRNATQTFTAGTEAVVQYNVEDLDNSGNFDISTGTFSAPVGGVYRVRACVRTSVSNFAAGDTSDVILKVNGSTNWGWNKVIVGGAPNGVTNCVDDLVVLATGATLQAFVNASGSATTRTVIGLSTSKGFTYLTIERVSD